MTIERNPLVSIVVLNYNAKEELELLFSSIVRSSYRPIEIIMVDNGSRDGSADFVKRCFPSVGIIENGGNLGAAAGFNVGISASTGEYISLLSPGMEVDPGWLEPLVSVLENRPEVASVDAWLLDCNDRKRFDMVGAAGRYADFFGNIQNIAAGELCSNHEKRIRRVFAGMTLMRRKVLEELGCFDKDFFFGYEDMDLFFRVNMAGYTVLSVPDSVVYHKSGASSKRGKGKRPGFYYLEKRNRLISLVKNLPTKSLVFAFPVVFFENASYLAFWTLKGNKRNVTELVRSLLWFLERGNLRSLIVKRKESFRRYGGKAAPLRNFLVPYCGDLLRLLGEKYRTDESSRQSYR